MASLNVFTFDAEGRVVDFEVWLDDLQLFLQCDSKDGLSLFDLTSGASTAPAADADSTVRSQWLTRDAAARLAVRNHLPSTERAHFSQYKSARALYDVVVARYSSPTTAALSRLMLPYLFPDLAAFATVADLVAHLRTSDARYRAALPTEFLPTNSTPHWQAAMDAEMASWKSTGTYVDEVPPPGANIVSGMWIFRVKRPPGSPPAFKARYDARGFIYGLRQAPHEWHDTLRTTLAALGFAPSTAYPSLFLRTDTTLPPFYVLVYVDDLVFATADTEALAHVKSELQKRHTCTDLGELTSYLGLRITWDRAQRTITLTQSHMVQQVLQRFGFTYSSPQSTPLPTGHSLSAPPLDEFVEPSGPYPELVGCLITSGMGLVLGGWAQVVLTGHADAAVVTGSSCEAEIYAGAMAAQELRWLTYLLTNLGEAPRSPPVLYVDNKAMLALCQEHRLEHRTKHIALRYFLARELQQRGQLRLAYVASQANTTDVFTKALQPCDHQRLCTVLGLVPTVPHLLTS
ncbi:unnamed protein product [Closterium sp. NIES-54]